MLGNNWTDIAWFVGKAVLGAVIWAAILGPAGIVAGILLWRFARRRKLLDAPWPWYRYVRWLWAVLFIAGAALAFAYGGAWLGAGRSVKNSIHEDRVLDKVFSHLLVAVFLDRVGYEATGDDSAAHIQKVLGESEQVTALAREDWRQLRLRCPRPRRRLWRSN